MESKSEIRKRILESRNNLSEIEKDEFSNKIAATVLANAEYKKADIILCYLDYNGEVYTDSIIEMAIFDGKKVYVPRVTDSSLSLMSFYRITSLNDCDYGYKGIREPHINNEDCYVYNHSSYQNTFMILPGVAFSKDNYRLGYGKGFYDRYLSDKPFIYKCGISYSMQLIDTLPIMDTDIKLNIVITENNKIDKRI